jgi:hypothetical protein
LLHWKAFYSSFPLLFIQLSTTKHYLKEEEEEEEETLPGKVWVASEFAPLEA